MTPCKWLFKVYLLMCISVVHTHIRASSYCTVIDSMCLESVFFVFFTFNVRKFSCPLVTVS